MKARQVCTVDDGLPAPRDCCCRSTPARSAPDPAFSRWLESLWPQAQSKGVSRKTFTAAIHGLEPDLTLPDLDLPSRKGKPPPGQAEFVQTPADYIRELAIARLAERGKKLAAEHRATLASDRAAVSACRPA